ncbi:hypothetical protein [Methylorubrum sp. Q1]|uniref:hypothetical protein n=1 Tax=Methylorubrum sp. Q1 TaxID=2562453 RepID=UPI00187D683B|nr:hypothetical protein [Methylorubrum sp. Q1]
MFLDFETEANRTAFIAHLEAERPDLASVMRVAKSQPVITFSNLAEADADWLRCEVSTFGRVLGDVRFEAR